MIKEYSFEEFEYIEHPFVFRDEFGEILFGGTPDRVLAHVNNGTLIVSDYKFGRIPVQTAESNLQLRCYLTSNVAPHDWNPEDYPSFRPSNLLRRKLCPGSLVLEANIPAPPNDDNGGKYAEEGSMLHAFMADKTKARGVLLPEQFETIERAEAMEAEFLDIVKQQIKPGWGFGAIIQPRISSKPFIVAYSPDDLLASRREIIALWHAAHQTDAPRRASEDACRYCRATAICPEHRAWVMAVEKIAHLPAYSWTAQDWDLFLTRKSALSKFIEERYEEAKQIKAANPDAIPGWELRDGVERRVVTDVVAAFQRFGSIITAREFSDCCELKIGELEKTIWKNEQAKFEQGLAVKVSQKEVKRCVNATLEGIIVAKRNKPSLVKTDL